MTAATRSFTIGAAWLFTVALIAGGAALYGSNPSIPPAPTIQGSETFAAGHDGFVTSETAERSTLDAPIDQTSKAATSTDFRKVRLGQRKREIQKILGRPTTLESYSIKDEEVWSWPYGEADAHRTFRVIFSEEDVVIWAGSSPSEAVDMLARESAAPSDGEQDR